MRGKSVAAPRSYSETTAQQMAELKKCPPGVSDHALKIERMNGDTEALDKDAASYSLASVQRGALPRVSVPLALVLGKFRKGTWHRSWDGGKITQDAMTRGWVSVPYHSIIRVQRGYDPNPDRPHNYVFHLRFFPCQLKLE